MQRCSKGFTFYLLERACLPFEPSKTDVIIKEPSTEQHAYVRETTFFSYPRKQVERSRSHVCISPSNTSTKSAFNECIARHAIQVLGLQCSQRNADMNLGSTPIDSCHKKLVFILLPRRCYVLYDKHTSDVQRFSLEVNCKTR